MQHGYYDSKSELIKRLNRAGGQINGVSKMIDNDVYCIDILTQISAVRAALDKVALELVEDHTRHCMMEADAGLKEQKAKELTAAMSRFIR